MWKFSRRIRLIFGMIIIVGLFGRWSGGTNIAGYTKMQQYRASKTAKINMFQRVVDALIIKYYTGIYKIYICLQHLLM